MKDPVELEIDVMFDDDDRAALVGQAAHYKRLADERGAEVTMLSDRLTAALARIEAAEAILAEKGYWSDWGTRALKALRVEKVR